MSETVTYEQTIEDESRAQSGAMGYIRGVAILNNPFQTASLHELDPEDQAEEIVTRASTLMRDGLLEVIRFSNQPEVRTSKVRMRDTYDVALPSMIDTQIAIYGHGEDSKITRDFPGLADSAPFPIIEESIYKRFCHGDFGGYKLPLEQMMDGVEIDEAVEEYCHPGMVALGKLIRAS